MSRLTIRPLTGRAVLELAAGAGAAFATALLWIVSRGKWSDALVDSGREWIVPDALSRGALLYRDVVYWFGPFTPYFQSAFFRLFGSSFQSLVAAGVVSAAAALAALYLALRRVTGRREALLWCLLAVPALVFMPQAGGALLGMGYRIWHAATFALLASWAATHPAGRPRLFFVAGLLAGLSGLCRTEWGLAALAAVVLVASLRRSGARGIAAAVIAAAAGFLLIFGVVLGGFVLAAGPAAVLEDGHLLFAGLPEETRTFLVAFSGVRQWRRGIVEMLYSAAIWTGLFLLLETLAAGKARAGARGPRIAALFALFVLLAVLAAAGGASGAVIWSAAPLVAAGALIAGLARSGSPRSAALCAFAFLGLALSYRRPFHIQDLPYVAPPLLFAFVSAAGLLSLRVSRLRERLPRERLRRALRTALVVTIGVAFMARARLYADWEGEPIAGTGGLLTARPEVAREIEGVARIIRAATPPGGTLVVFPEGELLNFLSTRRNPLRHELYVPGYLTQENEAEILDELERARPAAVIVWLRPTSEYGRDLFGSDFGVRIRSWLEKNYDLRPYRVPGSRPRSNPRFVYGLRRSDGS